MDKSRGSDDEQEPEVDDPGPSGVEAKVADATRRLSPALFKSEKQNWQTPGLVLTAAREMGPIGLDPATAPENPTCARVFYTEAQDGLSQPWRVLRPGEIIFMNPPYDKVKLWMAAIAAARTEALALVPARPDTRWFFDNVWDAADAVCFWKGRLRFVGAEASAPFPSAVVYYGERIDAFDAAFGKHGKVVVL